MSDYNRTQWPTEDVIGPFENDNEFLSNFYEVSVVYDGTEFPTSEHAYQAMKARDEEELYDEIASAESPNKAKKLGKKPSPPKNWEERKKYIMLEIVTAKFAQNPELRERLLKTGDELLVELNWWDDTYWGADSDTGEGKNMLGRILMEVRSSLQSLDMGLNRELIIAKADEYMEIATEERYQKEEPRQLERLPVAFEDGTWTWDDLEWIVRWKTHRSIGYFRRNDQDRVKGAIEEVVNTSSTRRKVDLLIDLSGIQVKMASAFLLFMNPDEYTVIDSRAGSVLSREGYLETPVSDSPSIDEYINYLQVCREIANQFEIDLRTLDRALWVLGG
ncbi:NADAR family protein [Halovenus rubra]|uniref:NADAR family protein n=2 Tax=Halovenus rubra TaxID=869890 RepID=A0ACC7E4M8_9EURY|nr:NADAR family protein [Halovenus rubra]